MGRRESVVSRRFAMLLMLEGGGLCDTSILH